MTRNFLKQAWPKNRNERLSYYLIAYMVGLIALGALTG